MFIFPLPPLSLFMCVCNMYRECVWERVYLNERGRGRERATLNEKESVSCGDVIMMMVYGLVRLVVGRLSRNDNNLPWFALLVFSAAALSIWLLLKTPQCFGTWTIPREREKRWKWHGGKSLGQFFSILSKSKQKRMLYIHFYFILKHLNKSHWYIRSYSFCYQLTTW